MATLTTLPSGEPSYSIAPAGGSTGMSSWRWANRGSASSSLPKVKAVRTFAVSFCVKVTSTRQIWRPILRVRTS
ncbi:Uncharacterised protein [Mycobacteroides abscessus subsp. abscessus]|nr:Uncharacterised protein [Mycobacteroides abscessus subsp. abscessus]